MRQLRYKIYATLLDSYSNYLNSDVVYERYYGWSENPPMSEEEFRKEQFQSFIDRINRVPVDSEAADRGTAFNEIVDCMVEKRKSDSVNVEKLYSDDTDGIQRVVALKATYNNREFTFPLSVCREFADYYKGALTQQRVEAVLPTAYGDVLVYGVIDELMPTSVHDIKTTGSYSVGKFKGNNQHLVYPYALMQNGSDIRLFEYNVAEFGRNGNVTGTYTESYTFVPDRDIPILKERCEGLIEFIEENRELITNTKIFGDNGKYDNR